MFETQHVSLAENRGTVLRTFNSVEADLFATCAENRPDREVSRSVSFYRTPDGKYFVEHTVVSHSVKMKKGEDYEQPTLAQPPRFGIRPHDRFVEGNKRNK